MDFDLCSLYLNVFVPPLPEDQCPNFLDFPNPLGITKRKEWSEIWILLLIKGLKLPPKKKLIFDDFFLQSGYFVIGVTIRIGREMLCLPYAGFSPTRPSGPSWSRSRDVCMFVCLSVFLFLCLMSPFHVSFFEASHWASDQQQQQEVLLSCDRVHTSVSPQAGELLVRKSYSCASPCANGTGARGQGARSQGWVSP